MLAWLYYSFIHGLQSSKRWANARMWEDSWELANEQGEEEWCRCTTFKIPTSPQNTTSTDWIANLFNWMPPPLSFWLQNDLNFNYDRHVPTSLTSLVEKERRFSLESVDNWRGYIVRVWVCRGLQSGNVFLRSVSCFGTWTWNLSFFALKASLPPKSFPTGWVWMVVGKTMELTFRQLWQFLRSQSEMSEHIATKSVSRTIVKVTFIAREWAQIVTSGNMAFRLWCLASSVLVTEKQRQWMDPGFHLLSTSVFSWALLLFRPWPWALLFRLNIEFFAQEPSFQKWNVPRTSCSSEVVEVAVLFQRP